MKFITKVLGIIVFSISLLKAEKKLQLVFFGESKSLPEKVSIYEPDFEMQDVTFSQHSFSETFTVKSSVTQLYLLKKGSVVDPKQPNSLSSAPSVILPEGWNKILLIALPDKSNKRFPVKIIPICANDDVFNNGDLLFCNYSNVAVAGKLGKHKLALKVGGQKKFSDPTPPGKKQYVVKLDTVDLEKSTKNMFLRRIWGYNKLRRSLFIFYNKKSGLPSYRTYFVHSLD